MGRWTDEQTEIEGVRKAARNLTNAHQLAAYVYDRASAYVGPNHEIVTTALIEAAISVDGYRVRTETDDG